MPLLTEQQVRTAAREAISRTRKSAPDLLREAARAPRVKFDIFLSHSIRDAEIVLGVVEILEKFGLQVYVDWLIDPSLDRENVTASTATRLRGRMRQSKALIYIHTANSPDSKWMPWELGFFDGYASRVAILPIVQTTTYVFSGQEYLGIYPYINVARLKGTAEEHLWVKSSASEYRLLGRWLSS